MRAAAITLVILYHAEIGPFTGGFIGVDIFFVISGFLIMSILMGDIARGRLSLGAFYARRIRRIVPALVAMVAVVSSIAMLVMPPAEFMRFGQSLVAAAGSLSNVYFDRAEGSASYFAGEGETRLLLHTWSLSVEEQFYLLLPIALTLSRACSRRVLVAAFAAVATASFALSVILVALRPMDGFYLVFPRAWELLAGCLLALMPPLALPRRWTRETLSVVAVALIAVAALGFTRATPFPGAAALLPCGGAILLIAAGSAGPTLVGGLLAARPIVYLGRISYSLYLWHWPSIVFVAQAAQVLHLGSGELTRNAKLLILAISFAAAIASYHWVEQPFRRPGAGPRRGVVAGGLAATAAVAALGLFIVAGDGLPHRFDGLAAANLAQAASKPSEACYHYLRRVTDARDFRRCDEDTPRRRNIVVLGDSIGGSLTPLLRAMQREGRTGDLGIVSAIVAGCPVSETIKTNRSDRFCNSATRFAYDRALERDVDIVVVAFSPWWTSGPGLTCASKDDACGRTLSAGEAEALFLRGLDGRVEELLRAGKKLVIQLPLPTYDRSIPLYLAARASYGRIETILDGLGIVQRPRRFDYPSMTSKLRTLAQRRGVEVFDARSVLCRGLECDVQRDGVSLYIDHTHIAANRIGMLEERLEMALAPALTADVAEQ